MKLFSIVFLLAVTAAEALGEICNSQQTPTKLIARRTWPSQTATTTAKPTTDTTTASPKSRTTAKPSTVLTTNPTTTKKTTAGTTPAIPLTSSTKSSSTLSSTSTTRTTSKPVPTSGPILFNCSVNKPACRNMCGNATSTSTGVVQSPNFPGDYGKVARNCGVYISAPVGWMIQLNFTTFNLETGIEAYVSVHDDLTPLLSSATGNTIPALVPATINKLYIYFICSASSKPITATYNWQATFSVTSQGSSCSMLASSLYPECGNMCTNVTSAGSGVVQSPNFPGDYGNEIRYCRVIIVVPAGKRIQLTFTTFNLEFYKANVWVRDRNTTYLSSVTGSTIPAVVTTTANIMYIWFPISTSTKPNTATYNWQATYTAV